MTDLLRAVELATRDHPKLAIECAESIGACEVLVRRGRDANEDQQSMDLGGKAQGAA